MVFVTVDRAGRLVLPKKIREEMETDVFDVFLEKQKSQKRVILKPRESLESLFGKFPDIDAKKFRRQHEEDARRDNSG